MIQKMLLIVIMLVTLVGGVFAQEGERVASPFNRVYHPATNVALIKEGDSFFLVLNGDLPDGCAILPNIRTERIGVAWFVDIYRDIPFGEECGTEPLPFEEKIATNDLFEADEAGTLPMFIVLNGTIFGVERDSVAEGEAPLLSTLWVPTILPYDTITTRHTTEGDMEITIGGTLTDGCAIPIYRAMEDWQNPGFVTVEAYATVNIAAMCAQVMTPFEIVMRAPVFTSLAINGVSVPFDPAMNKDTQAFREEALTITSATAESVEGVLPNVKITVSGITDGCENPIQIVPIRSGDNTYVVKVVRVLPADIVCTMIARDFTEELLFAPSNLIADAPLTFIIGNEMITP
ncbi:MAG: hypothetical protein SFZ02_20690 [bacterium]|nr:hypothetical protein [bacterium]